MRSIGDEDVSAIAKSLGGGGHRNAASCVVSEPVFAAWRKEGDMLAQERAAAAAAQQ